MFCLILNVEDEADDMHVQKKDESESWTVEKGDEIKFEDQGSVEEKLALTLMVCRLLMDGVCHGHVPSGTPEVSGIRRSQKLMEVHRRLSELPSGIFNLDPMAFSAGPIDIQSRGTKFGQNPAQAGLAESHPIFA